MVPFCGLSGVQSQDHQNHQDPYLNGGPFLGAPPIQEVVNSFILLHSQATDQGLPYRGQNF